MTERFNKAFNALTKAYFEGTLAAGNCMCCVVGNLCADAAGIDIREALAEMIDSEQNFPTSEAAREILRSVASIWFEDVYGERGIYKELRPYKKLDSYQLTGYKPSELAAIEQAFEKTVEFKLRVYPYINNDQILEDQYKGLCAVIDVLLSFEPEESTENWKEKMRHPKMV